MKSNKEQLVKFLEKIDLRLRIEKDVIPFDNNSEVEKFRKEVKSLSKTNKECQDTATQLLKKIEILENENKNYSQIISNSKSKGHSIELEVAKDEIKKLQTTANMWKEKTNELSKKLDKTIVDNNNLKQMNIAWEK
jgi:predicted RNase H-like nuclease (RuvC/YqgF family)